MDYADGGPLHPFPASKTRPKWQPAHHAAAPHCRYEAAAAHLSHTAERQAESASGWNGTWPAGAGAPMPPSWTVKPPPPPPDWTALTPDRTAMTPDRTAMTPDRTATQRRQGSRIHMGTRGARITGPPSQLEMNNLTLG